MHDKGYCNHAYGAHMRFQRHPSARESGLRIVPYLWVVLGGVVLTLRSFVDTEVKHEIMFLVTAWGIAVVSVFGVC